VSAQENIVEEIPIRNRINPDSLFYGIDIALEKIGIALMRNPEKKVALGLAHAQERLLEIRAMKASNNEVGRIKAEKHLNEGLNEIEINTDKVEVAKEIKDGAKARVLEVLKKNNITRS